MGRLDEQDEESSLSVSFGPVSADGGSEMLSRFCGVLILLSGRLTGLESDAVFREGLLALECAVDDTVCSAVSFKNAQAAM